MDIDDIDDIDMENQDHDDDDYDNEDETSATTTTTTTTTPSQKEGILQNLENKPFSITGGDGTSSITLELGDVIEIYAPTNPDIHDVTAIITYIDEEKIKLINISTMRSYQINITDEGRFTDETITQVALLNRSEEKGYARQNGLLMRTWIDIHFGGEIPAIISGEITNLDEDMIEVTTYPELRTIYIDFAYRGIPENLPIEDIIIREKPASLRVKSLSLLKGRVLEEGEVDETGEGDYGDEAATQQASIEYNDMGESIIRIPENAVPDENIRNTLQDLYLDANTIVFGERLGEVAQMVEVPEGEQRYSIETQVTDFMEELLSTIPNSQRTKRVLDNIHIIIDRFKELRATFSKFDSNANVYDAKTVGPYYKPLVDYLKKMDKKLKWIVPVVSLRKKIYYNAETDKVPEIPPEDILMEDQGSGLINIGKLQMDYYNNNSTNQVLEYTNFENYAQQWLRPFDKPFREEDCLKSMDVVSNIDTIVNSFEGFYSTVFANSDISRRQYVIQRYNLGSIHLEKQVLKSGKTVYNVKNMTPNDSMCIKSLIMLPEPVVRFSAIDLPSTNILTRTNLHKDQLMIFRLLKKNTDIIPHVIEDVTKEVNYEQIEKDTTIEFLKGIHEFMLDKDVLSENIDNKYEKFLDTIVPNTRYLIRLIRKYIKDKISFVDVVQQLEPFMIYTDGITYKQYMEIRFFIKEQIKELKKTYQEKSVDYSMLKNAKYDVNAKINPVLRILSENREFVEQFFQSYSFLYHEKANTKLTGQEILVKIAEYDNGNLYTNMITSLLISLMTPNNLMDALTSKPKIDDLTDLEKVKPTDCNQRYLTKKYTSIKDLQDDNNREDVYYDEDFDDTPYDILKKYEKNQKNMSAELFTEFLAENLIYKHDCPPDVAPTLAATIIAKKKRVTDGEYAMLEMRPVLEKGTDETALTEKVKSAVQIEAEARKITQYYRRIKNNWVTDNSIGEETFIDNNTLFCNIGKSCFKNTKNSVCENTDDVTTRVMEITKRKMLDEFDRRYAVNIEDLEKRLEKNIEYHLKMLGKLQVLKETQLYKANNLAYEIGNYAKNTDDLIVSPYVRLRELVLGQDDFSKRQFDICRFMEAFCRSPMVAELDESPYWGYCKETNTKLFPYSLYNLADAFVTGNYARKLDEVCASVGILSDDGDAIVDKHSGYILRKLELSTEEGFDEGGFRVTTHDIIEQDLGTTIMEALGKKERPVFENPTNEMIYNVFSKICEHVDIPIESIYDFVMRISNELIAKNVMQKEAYEKRAVKYEKEKGKALKSYSLYKNEIVVFIIASVLLISIQTAVPSFQTRKTFPGCVRSFSGYPFDGGVEDMTGLKYIACILNKTADKSIEPWDAIKSIKVDTIVSRMKEIIEKFIMSRSDITELYTMKREYILNNPEKLAMEEHSISKWRQFMPPIVPFHVVKSIHNVSSDFVSDMVGLFRKGHKDQFASISVLKSKILKYGYGIIEIINGIVKTKNTILKTMTNIPFLENACCNETFTTNPYVYFNTNSDNQIQQINTIVQKLIHQMGDVKTMTTAALIYDPTFTGVIYPTVIAGQLDENIYATVIKYCNLDNEKPIPLEFQTILSEKLPMYDKNASIQDKIEMFKRNGKRFTIETLHQILRIVYEKNIVHVENPEAFQEVDSFREIVQYLDNCNSIVFEKPLRELINEVIDTYNPKVAMHQDSAELRSLKRYLSVTNTKMYNIIVDFFEREGKLSRRELEKVEDFLLNASKWKIRRDDDLYYDEELYTVTKFIQNAVYSFTKVYPNVLLNEDGFYKNVPKHWDISNFHSQDITNFITKNYAKIEAFKKDNVLMQLLQHVNVCLLDIHLFVKNIPVYTEIVKTSGDNTTPLHFYSLFDKETTFMLHNYCLYSCLYEYIISSDDNDLLRTNVQSIKANQRRNIAENADPANRLISQIAEENATATADDLDEDLQEIQINLGNKAELKNRVCSLLFAFIDVEIENKQAVNFTYKEIKDRVTRSKDKEKKNIIRNFGNMDIEERRVENMLKNFRIGRWNVGQQKGLVSYDKGTYERERRELMMDMLDEIETGRTDLVTEMVREVIDMEGDVERDAEEEELLETVGFQGLGNGDGFTDGVFYEEDRDEDDYE